MGITLNIPMPINCVDCDNRAIRPLIGCKLIFQGCANCGRHPNCPIVEAIPKDNVYKVIQEMMNYEHEGFINISLARLEEILKKCGVSEDGNDEKTSD